MSAALCSANEPLLTGCGPGDLDSHGMAERDSRFLGTSSAPSPQMPHPEFWGKRATNVAHEHTQGNNDLINVPKNESDGLF